MSRKAITNLCSAGKRGMHDTTGAWLYRAGGLSALALGLSYFAIIALYVPMGAPATGAEPKLAYIAGHAGRWWAILGLSVLTDFLFAPIALSLYAALKVFNRNAMLLATACIALFIFLDLALTWPNYGVLIKYSAVYSRATNEAQRAAVVTAANYPSAVLESGLLFVYNTLVLAVGILITGLVMLNGVFSKSTAYLGVLTGILGIASVVGSFFGDALSAGIIITSMLTTVWVIFVGYTLWVLGQQFARDAQG
ncbi:MAG: hypothetical protein SFV51_13360 [Bryobacteraceae bacterium]|nr:hypothetical protein [Bryobacteraceae bacterium]